MRSLLLLLLLFWSCSTHKDPKYILKDGDTLWPKEVKHAVLWSEPVPPASVVDPLHPRYRVHMVGGYWMSADRSYEPGDTLTFKYYGRR